jgi:DNA polymerase III alpha subunit
MLYGLCETDEQRDRVSQELELYIKHGMYDVLHVMKYIVDTLRANNIVWGVGRGSSVASYVLYLIGVHKVDSIKYKLPIEEFFKEI